MMGICRRVATSILFEVVRDRDLGHIGGTGFEDNPGLS